MNSSFLEDKYVLVESLIKISYAIEGLYQKLYKLEAAGKKNSDEYNKILEYLDMSLEYEEELYQEKKLDALVSRELIDLIINQYLNSKMTSDIESIINRRYENAYLRRVVNKLTCIMKNDYFGMNQIVMDDIFETRKSGDIDFKLCCYNIHNVMMNDYISRILVLLEEEIIKTSNLKLKQKLIRVKYFISFIYSCNEKENIYNHFDIVGKALENAKLMAYLSGLNETEFRNIENALLIKEIRKIIYKILLKDKNIKENDEKTQLQECFIRALFMMMEEETIGDIENEINNLSNNNSLTVKKIVNNTLKYSKNDKTKQISLKLW